MAVFRWRATERRAAGLDSRRAVLFGALLLTILSCEQQSSPRLTPLAPPAGTGVNSYFAESAAVVIPPGANHPQCPAGRAVFAYGGTQRTMSVDLGPLVLNQAEPVDPAQTNVPIPTNTTDLVGVGGNVINIQCSPLLPGCIGVCEGNWTQFVPRFTRNLTDMALTRLPSGDLLYAGLGSVFRSPQVAFCAVPSQCNCSQPAVESTAILFNRSTDCGRTWTTVLPALDVTKILNGRYSGRILGSPPGFDRQKLYFDPFDDAVFLSVGALGTDPDGAAHQDTLVFKSTDQGDTWSVPTIVSSRAEAAPMTSTQEHLVVANCPGGQPTLHWSADGGNTFRSAEVNFVESGQPVPCDIVASADLVSNIRNPFPSVSVSRGPLADAIFLQFDTVRVAYSSIEQVEILPDVVINRGILRVVNVFIPLNAPELEPIVSNVATIRATAPASHVLQASFVETDRFEFDPVTSGVPEGFHDSAALYWLEVPHIVAAPFIPFGAGITARWAPFAQFSMLGGPRQLALNNGQAVTWAPNLFPGTNPFMGDFVEGAFFFMDLGPIPNRLFFLTQWPQSDQGVDAGPNLYLHYNITSIFSPGL